MKKRRSPIKELKRIKIGFKSCISIYKEKFTNHEITFKPKFSITKNITFPCYGKVANNLAKAFKKTIIASCSKENYEKRKVIY